MTLEQKITAFAFNEAAWLAWLLLGLSIGISVAVSRAVSLLVDNRAVRGTAARFSIFIRSALVAVASGPEQK